MIDFPEVAQRIQNGLISRLATGFDSWVYVFEGTDIDQVKAIKWYGPLCAYLEPEKVGDLLALYKQAHSEVDTWVNTHRMEVRIDEKAFPIRSVVPIEEISVDMDEIPLSSSPFVTGKNLYEYVLDNYPLETREYIINDLRRQLDEMSEKIMRGLSYKGICLDLANLKMVKDANSEIYIVVTDLCAGLFALEKM